MFVCPNTDNRIVVVVTLDQMNRLVARDTGPARRNENVLEIVI